MVRENASPPFSFLRTQDSNEIQTEKKKAHLQSRWLVSQGEEARSYQGPGLLPFPSGAAWTTPSTHLK